MKALKVSGKDSADFLHRVTAGPIRPLKVGEGAGGLLLNGQSRMIAQFDVLRTGEAEFLLVSPEPCFSALQEGLERLHFSEDLSMEVLPLNGLIERGENPGRTEPFSHEDYHWPAPVPGYVISLQEKAKPKPEGWDFDRIGAKVPWPPHDWSNNTPALEAGVLGWIDRNKGCYPGQEVVERSLNVGHPARLLLVIEGENTLTPDERVALKGGGEGTVASVARNHGKTRAFLRLPWAKREAAPEGFHFL